jgi:hypothetical protein
MRQFLKVYGLACLALCIFLSAERAYVTYRKMPNIMLLKKPRAGMKPAWLNWKTRFLAPT